MSGAETDAADATLDLQQEHIARAVDDIDPVFRDTPQFVDEHLSSALGREVLVKVETMNPIGSFKARGASVLVRRLDPGKTWVCSTAGNFGQALAWLARERGGTVEVFVSPDVSPLKVDRMRGLGARVEVVAQPETTARAHAANREDRVLVIDGRDPAMAEGAGTIGIELAAAGPIDTFFIQVGDGALISGVACWLRSVAPATRIVGVCARGAPAMAHSVAAGRAVSVVGEGTIATALAVTEPIPESVARVAALVDDIVLVDEGSLRRAMDLIAENLGVLVEPAGAAGVAALLGHFGALVGKRAAVILTGAGTLAYDERDGRPRRPAPRGARSGGQTRERR